MGQSGLQSSSVSLICQGWRAFIRKNGLVFERPRGAIFGVRARHGVDDADQVRARRQVRAKLQRHRLILGRVDVLLEERAADVGGVEPQSRTARPPSGRRPLSFTRTTYSPAVLTIRRSWASRAPLLGTMSARTLSRIPARPAARAMSPRIAHAFAAVQRVTSVFGCGPEGQRLVQNRLGRREILLDMRRREREHRADPLEALPVGVLGQAGGVVGVVRHAEQIADGVAIFLARELAKRDLLAASPPGGPPRPRRAGRRSIRPRGRPPRRSGRGSSLGGISPALMRSMIAPHARRRRIGRSLAPACPPEVPLLLCLAVAAHAVLRRTKGFTSSSGWTARTGPDHPGASQQKKIRHNVGADEQSQAAEAFHRLSEQKKLRPLADRRNERGQVFTLAAGRAKRRRSRQAGTLLNLS